jgi:hypothetical protein
MFEFTKAVIMLISVCILNLIGVADITLTNNDYVLVEMDCIFSFYSNGFIFIGPNRKGDIRINTIKHERGHGIQQKKMGNTYPIIELLSLGSCMIGELKGNVLFHRSMPWEIEATRLGGAYGF